MFFASQGSILPQNPSRWDWDATTVHAAVPCHTEKPWNFALVVPARNEEHRISRTLEAAARSIGAQAEHGGIVVLVNNSADRTFDKAVAALRNTDVPHLVIDAELPDGFVAAGYARLAAFEAALCRIDAGGILLTTDADTVVRRDWVAANSRALKTADVVFGRIEPDPAELAALPQVVRDRFHTETEYRHWSTRLANALDPGLPVLHVHGFTGGASIGCRGVAYAEIGGMPCVASGEDGAFAERAFARDLRVVRCSSVSVTTSCRLRGRAPGGMAETLARWRTDTDTRCDAAFEPPCSTYLRAWARARVRSLWSERKGAQETLRLLGIFADEAELYQHAHFGQAWRWVENCSPPLRRSPMTFSELGRALPELRRLTALAMAGTERDITPEAAA